MKRHRRSLSLLAGLAALGALLLGAWSAAQFRSATLGRAWFVAPTQLAVAADGTLFVGLGDREVQVYAPDGTPRSAWYTDGAVAFALRPVGEDEVDLVFADDRVERFDAGGARRDATREPGAFARLGASRREGVDREGVRYALRPEGLVRLDPDGPRVLVPAPPPPLAWLGPRPLVPITAVLIGSLLGLVACVGLSRRVPEPV